jgi:arylsulfatase A-like enzyme
MLSRRTLLSSLTAGALTASAAPERRPNIVLLVADDLGYGELGCQGNPQIPTPHIDSIARQGVRFTNGYVSAPYCSPSRAGLLTGRYQTRFGHELNPVGAQNLLPHVGLPSSETSIATCLQEAGYRTALIGKWHLGGAPAFHPLNRGFDEFFGFLHEGHFYVPPSGKRVISHLRPKEPPYDEENPLLRGRNVVQEPRYLTSAFAREAVRFVRRNAQRPFFLYVPFNSVHSPMQAEPADVDRFAHIEDKHRRVFAAMLSSLDNAVGAILGEVRKQGLERDTIVAFVSDNGGPIAELTSSNGPLRGQKGQLYEGGIRVPFLIQWPSRVPSGQTIDEPVISLDLLPTFVAAARGKMPSGLDGVDLNPLLRQEASRMAHPSLYWRYASSRAIRQGRWKAVRQSVRGQPGEWELYDLQSDLSERRDLAASVPERLKEMVSLWEQFDQQMVPPTPLQKA